MSKVKIVLTVLFAFIAFCVLLEMLIYHLEVVWSWLAASFGWPSMPHDVAFSATFLLLFAFGCIIGSRSSGK